MLTKHEVKQRIEKLREAIAHHEALYRETLFPIIDDAQFDALVLQLKQLEDTYPEYALPQTPASDGFMGQKVIPHRVPMLSIHATTRIQEIFDWLGNIEPRLRSANAFTSDSKVLAVMMPKLDGMALSLIYRKGALVYALTRGRAGEEGHEVTDQAKRLKNIPLRISETSDVIVRGEVMVSLKAYRQMQLDNLNSQYSSPRMAAVAALRSKDDQLSKQLDACFVAYHRYIFLREDASSISDRVHRPFIAQSLWLTNEGFNAIPSHQASYRIHSRDLIERSALENYLIKYGEARKRFPHYGTESAYADYATDGVVFAVNDRNGPLVFGQNEHHPHWMIAYKPPAESATSTLRAVTFNVSRTGAIIPVATIDLVEILNKQVTSVSLHSVGFLRTWNLHIGDAIKVDMVHEVVPQFQSAIPKHSGQAIAIPTHCPSCQTPLHATSTGLACGNRDRCSAQAVGRFMHFAGPKGMAIRGMGPSLIARLIDAGKLRTFSDIYRLTEADFREVLDGSERRARSLWVAVRESRVTTLTRLLIALGIANLGPSLARPLADYYDRDLLRILNITDPQELAASNLMPLGRAKSLITALQSHKDDLRSLLDLGVTWPILSHKQGNS